MTGARIPRNATDDDPLVQMNVRIPQSLRDQIDERRARKDLSRDVFMERLIKYALAHPPERTPLQNTMVRTAPPPHRRR